MFIIEAILALTVLGWIAFGVGIIAVFGSVTTFKTDRIM